jgi:hypothetical protein
MEVSNGTQNQIGRIALRDDAGLVTLGTELRGDHHQMSNWAPSARYRQRSTIDRGALAKLDHIRFQFMAADPYWFLTKDRRPESRDLNIGTECGKQVPD